MINKIASYNKLSDKGMHLIAKISSINEAMKALLTDSSQESINNLVLTSKELDIALAEYQGTLLDSFARIASDSDDGEMNVVEDENGLRL